MPRLPEATDLGNPLFRQARQSVSVSTPDYEGALGALGRGFSDIGDAAALYAERKDKTLKDEESFKTNISLLNAQGSFEAATANLDPSDPTYAEKRMKAWSDTFQPIVEGVQHPDNKMKFGEWAAENGVKTELEGQSAARDAGKLKTKNEIWTFIENVKKKIRDGTMDPTEGSRLVRQQIETAPGLFANDRAAIEQDWGVKFDASAAESIGLNLVGNARKAPPEWQAYEARLGPFLEEMKKAGFPLEIYSHYRTVEQQAKLYRDKVKELRAKGVPNPEQAARAFVAAPTEEAPHFNGASDISFGGKRLGEKGTEEATAKAHALAAQFGLTFRMDGTKGTSKEPWHLEAIKDGTEAPPQVVERGQSVDAILAVVEASPAFRALPVDQQDAVRASTVRNYQLYGAEDEKNRLLEGTRTVVDELASQYPDVADRDQAFEELRARISDPEAYENGVKMLDAQYSRTDEVKTAQRVDTYNTTLGLVMEKIDAKDPAGALALIPADMEEPDRIKLTELVRKGRAQVDDQWTLDGIQSLKLGSNEDRKKFMGIQLNTYVGTLSSTTLERLQADQDAMRKAAEAGTPDVVFSSASNMLEQRLVQLGIAVGKDADASDLFVTQQIRRIATENIEAAQNLKGGKLEQSEIEQTLDRTLIEYRTPKTGWITNKPLFGDATEAVTLKDVLKDFGDYETKYNMPPGMLLDDAATVLRRSGLQLTGPTLSEFLRRKKAKTEGEVN